MGSAMTSITGGTVFVCSNLFISLCAGGISTGSRLGPRRGGHRAGTPTPDRFAAQRPRNLWRQPTDHASSNNLLASTRGHFRHRHVRHAGAYLWFRGGSLQNHRSTGPRSSISFPSQTTRLGSSATDNGTADLIRQSLAVGDIMKCLGPARASPLDVVIVLCCFRLHPGG
jgi:hypothetical protein